MRAFVVADAIDMGQSSTLRLFDVVEDGSGGAGGSSMLRETEAFEREHAKMIFDERDSVVGRKDPIFERCLGDAES